MQVILVFLSVLSLELFRRFRIREPWKVLLLLVLSGGATAISTLLMIKWSEIPMEGHVLRFEQIYTEKPEDVTYVTANITTYLYTAYDAFYKNPSDRGLTLFFHYGQRENKSAKPRLYENREEFMKDRLYLSFRNSMPQPLDIDSVDNISFASYVYPSSIYQSEKAQSCPYYYGEDKDNVFSHHCLYGSTIRSVGVDSMGNHTKPYVNKLEAYALSKGVTKSRETTFTYNHRSSSFWEKIIWLTSANDLSRTNYRFIVTTSSVDSLNLSIRFEEPTEFHGLGNDHIEQSPFFITIGRSFSEKDNNNSVFCFHARHLESENIQAMRMFFICSVGAVFLGFFIASLLSVVGSLFVYFTTKHKSTTI